MLVIRHFPRRDSYLLTRLRVLYNTKATAIPAFPGTMGHGGYAGYRGYRSLVCLGWKSGEYYDESMV